MTIASETFLPINSEYRENGLLKSEAAIWIIGFSITKRINVRITRPAKLTAENFPN